jgi:5'-nucleotidase
MSQPRPRGWAVLRHLAVPALALAVVAMMPMTSRTDTASPGPARASALEPVSVSYGLPAGRTAKGNFLGYNDFHGAIDPPTGSGGVVNGTPAGGVEYLATWLKRLRAEARSEGRRTVTVGAGDLIGGTPLISAAFHDEPTIELMDEIGLQVSSVGNHEFDEGVAELIRLTRGGCHPVDGCQDGDGFRGAEFTYLAANTISKRTGLPILPPIDIRLVNGVPVGFVGVTLEGTPSIVNPAGIATVEFKDEVETANKWGALLKLFGVKAQVLLVHEGGFQSVAPPGVADPNKCENFSGPIVPIVAGLNPEFGLVVSGHTHQFYTCRLPNSSGAQTVVTSAGSNGRLITDIDFAIDRRTGRFAQIDARNVIVENGVRNPDGSWQTTAPGVYVRNPALVDPAAKVLADKYRAAVAPIANEVVGRISADIVNTAAPNGESPLGDVIADAQLAYTQANGAQIALMNPGGIRASLIYAPSGTEDPGEVTYGEAFTVQPFNNLVVTQTLTGAQLKEVLEQQFPGYAGQTGSSPRILQVSAGFTYTYDVNAPLGQRVSAMALNGTPIDPAASYRVTTNDFLANGGDGFTLLREGTDRATAPGFDVDALTAYLTSAAPVAPGPANRITRIG